MRTLKLIAHALILCVVLPVALVAVLGILFSPLHMTARATEPVFKLPAYDIPLVVDETKSRERTPYSTTLN